MSENPKLRALALERLGTCTACTELNHALSARNMRHHLTLTGVITLLGLNHPSTSLLALWVLFHNQNGHPHRPEEDGESYQHDVSRPSHHPCHGSVCICKRRTLITAIMILPLHESEMCTVGISMYRFAAQMRCQRIPCHRCVGNTRRTSYNN